MTAGRYIDEDQVAAGFPNVVRKCKSGFYYECADTVTNSTSAMNSNLGWAWHFPLGAAKTFDRIGLEVSTAVAASAIRLAIYGSGADGLPDALVLDAGTIDSTTTGFKEITINQALTAGLWWIASAAQGGAPTVRARQAVHTVQGFTGGGNANANGPLAITTPATLPGAFPANIVAAEAGGLSAVPRVLLRAA